MSWRDSLRPASFRGVPFKTEAASKAGGRRGQTLEFPKRNDPSDEDLGRKAKRFAISGYVIGPDHHLQADLLELALDAEGGGQLVTQLMGARQVRCETYTRMERRQEGGVTSFDMTFVEVGVSAVARISESTQSTVNGNAAKAEQASATAANAASSSSSPAAQPSVPTI